MNLNESIRDWVFARVTDSFPSLAVVDLVTMGETDDLGPPFLAIYETAADAYEQGGVMLPGVTIFDINCELHTVPAAADQEGTTAATEREYRRDLYDILGDRSMIDWVNGRNGWQVFDIRLGSPTTEPNEGRRISRWVLKITAAPN